MYNWLIAIIIIVVILLIAYWAYSKKETFKRYRYVYSNKFGLGLHDRNMQMLNNMRYNAISRIKDIDNKITQLESLPKNIVTDREINALKVERDTLLNKWDIFTQ